MGTCERGGASGYAFHGSQTSSRARYSGGGEGRARTGGDAAGGRDGGAHVPSGRKEERRRGGREGGSEEGRSGEGAAFLARVAFLRRKPAMARGRGRASDTGIKGLVI